MHEYYYGRFALCSKRDEHSKNCTQCEKDTNEKKYKRTDCTNSWWMVLSYIIAQLMRSDTLDFTDQLDNHFAVSFGLFGTTKQVILMLSIR